jgi:nucleoid DNA-binding protein
MYIVEKKCLYIRRKNQGMKLTSISVDGEVEEIIQKNEIKNLRGVFLYGLFSLTNSMPKTFEKLSNALNLNDKERELAKKIFLEKLIEMIKKGKMIYLKSLSSFAIYKALKESGRKIAQEDIYRIGGTTPANLRMLVKEEVSK